MLSLVDKLEKVSKYIGGVESFKVIGWGKNDYMIGYATNSLELSKLLKNRIVKGVVIEGNKDGSVCISFEKTSGVQTLGFTTQQDIMGYETKQLLVVGGLSSKSLKKEIERNNRFISRMIPVFSSTEELVEMNQIYVEYGKVKDLPLFNSLSISSNGLTLRVTKHQMSIVTGSGLVKIHNTRKNIDSLELAELVSSFFKTPKTSLYNAFSSLESEGESLNVKVI